MSPDTDRPRERLWRLGAAALAPPELLAILLGTGDGTDDAATIARRLLRGTGGGLRISAVGVGSAHRV